MLNTNLVMFVYLISNYWELMLSRHHIRCWWGREDNEYLWSSRPQHKDKLLAYIFSLNTHHSFRSILICSVLVKKIVVQREETMKTRWGIFHLANKQKAHCDRGKTLIFCVDSLWGKKRPFIWKWGYGFFWEDENELLFSDF